MNLRHVAEVQHHMYTVFQKKLYPFCFCNNFFNRKPIFTIFGKNVVKGIGNMQTVLDLHKISSNGLLDRYVPCV